MEEIESVGTFYVLSIKGGYYDKDGEIVESLTDARLFTTRHDAIEFRRFHDPLHRVDCSILLQLTVFIAEAE